MKDSHSDDALKMLAVWPENRFETMSKQLYELAENSINTQSHISSKVTCRLDKNDMICDATTLPLHYNNITIGTVVFLQSVRTAEQRKAVLQLFQWGCAWLESSFLALKEEQIKLDPLANILIKFALQDVPLAVAGHHICNVLTQEFECERSALGIVDGLQVHTVALSNQLRFDPRTSHIREMEAAMEEALDQKEAILYPKSTAMLSLVTQKHHTLSSVHKSTSILTIPFSNDTDFIGVISLLRPADRPFTEQELYILQHRTELLGSALSVKIRDEHSLFKVFFQGFKKRLKSIFGMGHLPLKISILGLVGVLTTLTLLKTEYYTYAKSSLEGAIQQVIVAPQDGFIESAEVRAGDKVESGQILLTLNNRDLKLQHEKLLNEHAKINKEYREALALRERAKVSILSAQIMQVDAQLNLVKEKLKRSHLKAPFSGIVVSGDLSQSLGAPVEKGEQLFEISPLGNYRVALSVDDHDISNLKIGQTGSLRLVGLPYDQISISISRITPVASSDHGSNYFHVEAKINDINDTRLRPGMQGIAKVQVGEDSVLWVWTHSLFERLRLWLWSIGL